MATDRGNLRELWGLLFDDPQKLNKGQLTRLLAAQQELEELLRSRSRAFPGFFSSVLQYHQRKEELGQLTTEELEKMLQAIRRTQQAFYASRVGEGTEDDIGDSFFESPPVDSDEHILSELLRERKAPALGR